MSETSPNLQLWRNDHLLTVVLVIT